jgi:hypothetical protein
MDQILLQVRLSARLCRHLALLSLEHESDYQARVFVYGAVCYKEPDYNNALPHDISLLAKLIPAI